MTGGARAFGGERPAGNGCLQQPSQVLCCCVPALRFRLCIVPSVCYRPPVCPRHLCTSPAPPTHVLRNGCHEHNAGRARDGLCAVQPPGI